MNILKVVFLFPFFPIGVRAAAASETLFQQLKISGIKVIVMESIRARRIFFTKGIIIAVLSSRQVRASNISSLDVVSKITREKSDVVKKRKKGRLILKKKQKN